MDLKEILTVKYEMDSLSERRTAMVRSVQGLIENARSFVEIVAPADPNEVGTDRGGRPKSQITPWVVIDRDGDRAICGRVEIHNYVQDGKERPFDGGVHITFTESTIWYSIADKDSEDNDDEPVLTLTGELFRIEEGAFIHETTEADIIADALLVPGYSVYREGEISNYKTKLERAESLAASLHTSFATIVDAARNPHLVRGQ